MKKSLKAMLFIIGIFAFATSLYFLCSSAQLIWFGGLGPIRIISWDIIIPNQIEMAIFYAIKSSLAFLVAWLFLGASGAPYNITKKNRL